VGELCRLTERRGMAPGTELEEGLNDGRRVASLVSGVIIVAEMGSASRMILSKFDAPSRCKRRVTGTCDFILYSILFLVLDLSYTRRHPVLVMPLGHGIRDFVCELK